MDILHGRGEFHLTVPCREPVVLIEFVVIFFQLGHKNLFSFCWILEIASVPAPVLEPLVGNVDTVSGYVQNVAENLADSVGHF